MPAGLARLNRPVTGYVPGMNILALESAAPEPLDSKSPVKQMPFA
jgi:hypothetical protein